MNDETTKFCFKHEIEHDDFCPQCEMEDDARSDAAYRYSGESQNDVNQDDRE